MTSRATLDDRAVLTERRTSLHPLLERRKAVRPAIVALVGLASSAWIGIVTWPDAGCFFEVGYALRLVAAAVYVASPVIVFVRSRRVQAIVACSLAWMLLVLPHVRWNHVKSFYVDARRIEPGMAVAQVRDIMRPYLEVRGGVAVDGDGRVRYRPTAQERDWGPRLDERADGLLFLHSVEGYTDSCEVLLDPSRRVREVFTVKD